MSDGLAERREAEHQRHIAEMADANEMLAEVFAGLRAALIAKGFTPEQAGQIVVTMRQEAAADAAAVANGFKKKHE